MTSFVDPSTRARRPARSAGMPSVEVRDVAHLQNILGALRVSDAVEGVNRVREAEGASA